LSKQIPVGIVGVSGYTGLELVKMLITHPYFELKYVANTEGGTWLTELHPILDGVFNLDVKKVDIKEIADTCKLVFLALPHKTAMNTAKELLACGVRVVDLSADYRLSLESYEKNYCKHEDADNLRHAVYSIPELHGNSAFGVNLIANPGCHVTASLLALAPFLSYIDLAQPIFIDSKTGISGAGKSPNATVHFVSVSDNVDPYNIIKHRHAIEIEEHASLLVGKDVKVTFVPSHMPMIRGMLASVYATLKHDIDVKTIIHSFYKDKAFIRVRKDPPHTKTVVGTHFADVYADTNNKALVSFCAIDNLLRGASSQALANANIMFGYEEGLAIPKVAYVP